MVGGHQQRRRGAKPRKVELRGRDDRRRRDSSTSSSESSAARRLRKAKKLMYENDAFYRRAVKSKEAEDKEEEYKRQGEVMAKAIAPEFEKVIAATAAPSAPPPAAAAAGSGSPPGGDGFSPAQLAQIKALMGGSPAAPAAEPPPAGSGGEFSQGQLAQLQKMIADAMKKDGGQEEQSPPTPPARRVRGKGGEPPQTLSKIQRALVKSLFNSKLAIEDGTYDEFEKQIEAQWPASRAIADNLTTFIKEQAPGTTVPKFKKDRAALFWRLLLKMD